MNVLDLFSGIGGFSLGLERAGMRTVAFCEINPYARRVLNKCWPDIPVWQTGIVGLNALLKRALTQSSLGSPVRTYHSLEMAPDFPEAVRDSSGTYFEPFAWFDHPSRCWRTWQRCLEEGWAKYSGTWPRSGMTRNGIAYRRAPLVPLIKETGYGSLLPTPEASNTKAIALRSAGRSPRNFLAPLPTPTVCGNYNRKGVSKTSGNGLGTVVRFATPTARDYRGAGRSRLERTGGKQGEPLPQQIGGPLNPTWVEWLMGFPPGWTALDALETPLSLKSRKSSGGQS